MSEKPKVFVGLSGGVDSSVAALRLMKRGFDVYGVFIKVWHPDWLNCNWEQERLDAMRVAAKLGIPFLTCDAEDAYKNEVADYFIGEYKAGRTPNPDVMCNKAVKFGAFLKFANEHGADYVATGHYAQVTETQTEQGTFFNMKRGVDTNKDQTYFLWTLTQNQLSQTLFPVGDTPKKQIREEAEVANLVTAEKKDSQGICFLGHIDIPEFLSHYIELVPGNVLSTEGEIIGSHKGALVYTRGQRHGFKVFKKNFNTKALYVTERDIQQNTITVSETQPVTDDKTILKLSNLNLIADPTTVLDKVEIQTRYRQKPSTASVVRFDDREMTLKIAGEAESFSIGQSCVLYQGENCLGGGIIS